MENLEKAKYEKRQEIDNAKKERLHLYVDDKDVFIYNQDRMRLVSEAESTGKIQINTIVFTRDEFYLLSTKTQAYERELIDNIVLKYKDVEAAENETEVSNINVESKLPNIIRITINDIRKEVEANKKTSMEIQAITFAKSQINKVDLSANKALEMQVLFPIWGKEDAEFGKKVSGPKDGFPGFRFQYKSDEDLEYLLYEVIKDHSLQAEWIPAGQMDLYKVVTVEHSGTIYDPIPYVQGMAFEKDKYYEQYGVVYLCILTTETGYPNDLKDLPTIVQEVK